MALRRHLDEIPEPGCYMTWEQAGEPVVLVHTEAGAVKAFYNVCSHRGHPLLPSPRKTPATYLQVPWLELFTDGELKAIRDPEDFRDLDFSCRSLAGIRCETFGKFIFVNFDPEAVSLLDWLGPISDEWREFQFDQCRLSARHSFDLDCNWKIAMEANTEVYHVPNIHPTTVAPLLDHRRNVNTLYANGHGRMVAPRRELIRLRTQSRHGMWGRVPRSRQLVKLPAPAFSPMAFSPTGYPN
ncbi:MAG: hypothetical protein CM15mP74_16370 [Halieaceae bacterium]|nr:MAG: hypothetical protein CM15mP74_16370 [Halieaceae bacterium]